MKYLNVSLLILLFIAIGCSPKIRTSILRSELPGLNKNDEIVVLSENDQNIAIPENSQLIGTLKIGDTGFTTDCGYDKIISDAKAEARKMGGNILKISELKKPSRFGSSCFRIKAEVYRNLSNQFTSLLKEYQKNKNKSRLPSGADYAKVYFYRPKAPISILAGYKIRMDKDSIICKIKNGRQCEITIKDFKQYTFWAQAETIDSLQIDIKKGQEYYIRCSANPGFTLVRPYLDLVENRIAREEISNMK